MLIFPAGSIVFLTSESPKPRVSLKFGARGVSTLLPALDPTLTGSTSERKKSLELEALESCLCLWLEGAIRKDLVIYSSPFMTVAPRTVSKGGNWSTHRVEIWVGAVTSEWPGHTTPDTLRPSLCEFGCTGHNDWGSHSPRLWPEHTS